MARERRRLLVTGIVQGVGFRPFVYRLAVQLGLTGFVRNGPEGVTIEAQGEPGALELLLARIQSDPPPAAVVDAVVQESIPPASDTGFVIAGSESLGGGEAALVPPDLATCPECLRELFDPANRRYRYPFLNCTNCGPRFTIIRGLPYDRPQTTMAPFRMCAACEREYHDPRDRRFHAQPTACPACGPTLTFEPGSFTGESALQQAREWLREGRIVAIKGLGGFHLACDAANDAAVAELRRRKGRGDKPFALMAASLDAVRRFAVVDHAEAALLHSPERPIVLLRSRDGAAGISPLVAPGQDQLGFLLPYTPLHYLLLEDGAPLVMTSGNRADEPIARTNAEARERLAAIAGGFLLHDRDIESVCDDSVIGLHRGRALPIRRSRGFAPMPVRLPFELPRAILAVGGELKSTLCLAHGRRAFFSQHIGDMGNLETLQAFERAAAHLSALLRRKPELLACDAHPGYLSSDWARRFAAEQGLAVVEVQHHHAHIAGLMAEAGMAPGEAVLGVAFDGTGFGPDGAIWGGELLLADYGRFERLGHLRYIPLPGGDAAIQRPYRAALAHLAEAGIDWTPDLACAAAAGEAESAVLRVQLSRGLNCVPTSSFGRLFDAVASLTGLCHHAGYEAQGAMLLEARARRALAAESSHQAYEFGLSLADSKMEFDARPMLARIVTDLRGGDDVGRIAARFHGAVANLVVRACILAREQTGLSVVALTGGVFQNVCLLGLVVDGLENAKFRVLTHRVSPPNDGGLALGQAAVAAVRDASGRES